jgi:23S rRNA (guanosine2251-2'-O)-methyltransferase
MHEDEWLDGITTVEAVLEAARRDVRVIYINDSRRDVRVARIQQEARLRMIPFERLSPNAFDQIVPTDYRSDVVARVGPRRFHALADLVAISPAPVIVMLDGVEDPFNLGQSIRALFAADIDGLVLPPRNRLVAGNIVARASAGASERMLIAIEEATAQAIDFFRSVGFSIACATGKDARPMEEVDLTGPLFLIIGGEKRGISRAVLALADVRVAIPYGRAFPHDLGSAVASAVLAFEVLRQRRLKNKGT